MGRKHCRKRGKLLVTSNFSFFYSVFKKTREYQGWFEKSLIRSTTIFVTSNFSFFCSVFERLVLKTRKKQGLVWERVKMRYHTIIFVIIIVSITTNMKLTYITGCSGKASTTNLTTAGTRARTGLSPVGEKQRMKTFGYLCTNHSQETCLYFYQNFVYS